MESDMKHTKYLLFAYLAALLYALNTPLAKLLMEENGLSPYFMAGLLYLGAGSGMTVFGIFRNPGIRKKEEKLTWKEFPDTAGMVILDIIAPILLMNGLKISTPENVSLLNNFEIVATSLIAFFVFREKIGRYLWIGIILIVCAGILLVMPSGESLRFSFGSVYVILASLAWGLENNLTRRISSKDPLQIVVIKGLFSGLGSLAIAFLNRTAQGSLSDILFALLLGFVSYGLSIYCYVYAQRYLGASTTSAYYAIAPFLGVFLSLLIFQEIPPVLFFVSLLIMALGTLFVNHGEKIKDTSGT